MLMPNVKLHANRPNNSQHCWANDLIDLLIDFHVRLHLAKHFTGFKLGSTTHNNMLQGEQTDATWNIQQCLEFLASNVASICLGLNGVFVVEIVHL